MADIHARLAHIGIYATDKKLLEHFYTTVLGLVVTDRGTGRSGTELTFAERQFPQSPSVGAGRRPPRHLRLQPDQPDLFHARQPGRPAHGAPPSARQWRDRDAGDQPRQRLVMLFQGPGGQHRGGVSRHSIPCAAAARRAAGPDEVGFRDHAGDRGGCRSAMRVL